MKLIVNGQAQTVDPTCTVRELLEILDMAAAPCAVEVNRELIPRADHEKTTLRDGDQVEVVTLVGGG